MTPAPASHPAKEQLVAFGQGRLADDESSRVEQHLEVCDSCCETLLNLQDDTFTGLVRRARPVAPPADTGAAAPGAAQRTDGDGTDGSADSATLLVQSGESAGNGGDLPAELRDHPRYRVLALVGRGGMGTVYRAEHRLMHRPVAIKLVNPQLIRRPQAVERFRREVRAAAKLSHPNIVTAYDAEQAGGAHFLVMEFVEGIDLATFVAKHGPMPVRDACRCVQQAADGLQHAHECGMVHRDIKPHNLMLSAGNQVRILDFGLAGFATEEVAGNGVPLDDGSTNVAGQAFQPDSRALPVSESDDAPPRSREHLTAMGSLMGTPDYIAPEQAADAHSADIRADIYSLGCTLHFLLTGRPPFEADSVPAKLKAHAEHSPPALTTLRKDVPPELALVVARMMAKDPAKRLQTPADVVAALAPFVSGMSLRCKRIGRAIAAAIAVAALAVTAAVIYVRVDSGEFTIDASDDVAVRIEKDRVKIRDTVSGRTYELTAGRHSIRKGDYVIKVAELPDGLTVDAETFRLARGGEARVTVTFKPDPAHAATTEPDEERLQGNWTLLSMQVGERKFDQQELAGQATITLAFKGDKVNMKRIALSGDHVPAGAVMREFAMDGRFFLDTTADPKRIAVMVPKDNLNSLLGIYRLEGDRLTLCCFENPETNDYPTGFATQSGSRAVLYEFESAPYALVEVGRFTGHEGGVSHAIVSPDSRLGISCGFDRTIRVWDIATQEERRVLKGHEDWVFGLAISADGSLLASCDKAGGIRLWDLQSGEQVGELTGHTEAVTDLAFIPDGTHLLSAGFDETLRLWHVPDRRLVRTFEIGAKVEKMAPLSDGRHVMLSGAHTGGWGMATYDLEQGGKVDTTPSVQSSLAVSADGRKILIGSVTGALKVTADADHGTIVVQLKDPRAGQTRDAAITPDGRFAITTTRDAQMHLWDLHEGKLLSTATNRAIGTISLSPDGRFALTIGRDSAAVAVWHLPESVIPPSRQPVPAE